MLEHYRVVDLCSGISQFAGYLLASLGAEVIAVESPAGSPTRHLGPFVDDVSDPEKSLLHWAYNQGKKSVTLDAQTPEGYAQLGELLASADAVIQDANHGQGLNGQGLNGQGLNGQLSYEAFAQLNPAIVHATITPYGMGGPRGDWLGSDLTAVAGSGFLHASGDSDRPPIRVSAVPQSFLQAAGDAAAAVLIALYEAQRSGQGQHIDISAMESMTHGNVQNLSPRVNAQPVGRLAGGLSIAGIEIPLLFPCADGHTVCVSLMGAVFAPFSRRLVEWENEEGFASEEIMSIDWENFGVQVLAGEVSVEVAVRAFETHRSFLATKTKQELWEAAFERNILLTPSATVKDLLTNEHFAQRNYWQTELVGGTGDSASGSAGSDTSSKAGGDMGSDASKAKTALFPGHLAKFSEGQPKPRSAVPRLGEHNDQIDLARSPVATRSQSATPSHSPSATPSSAASTSTGTNDTATDPAAAPSGTTPSDPNGTPSGTTPSDPNGTPTDPTLPLAGLKVLEFSWVIATPSAIRILADYGATVVKVETASRPDTMRTVNPFVDEEPHPDNSVGYGIYNAGKRSISLDMSKPESREVVNDLIKWADITTESFSPGAFSRMGYDYETLSQINPGLIMLSSTLLGQTGPFSDLAGYGFMAAAIAGFYEIAGWPDRGPAGPSGPYTDYLAPRVIVTVLLAALEQRKKTGRGCYIDMSQTEAALHYLSPAILNASVNGHDAQRCGNDDPFMSPHGVFASKGDDAWVAIACADEMWPALADELAQSGNGLATTGNGLAAAGNGPAAAGNNPAAAGNSPAAAGNDTADWAGLTQQERRARADEIAAAITDWTTERTNDEAATALQARGIDAYAVNDAQGCCDDPQFEYRNHHIEVPQSYAAAQNAGTQNTGGTMWTHNCRSTMSRTPAQVWRGGPCLGEDNFEVLSDYLGYDADKIADLAVAEVLG